MIWTKASCKITSCDCKHEYQDKMYGRGQRVHNPCKRGTDSVDYRCTVCGKKK